MDVRVDMGVLIDLNFDAHLSHNVLNLHKTAGHSVVQCGVN